MLTDEWWNSLELWRKRWLQEFGMDAFTSNPSEAFLKGVESVSCIRCSVHRATPILNTNANGSECGACIQEEGS